MIFIGLIATKAITLSALSPYLTFAASLESAFIAIGLIVGSLLLTFGSILFYNWFSNLFRFGRVFNTTLNKFFRENFLKIILLFLSLLYIPITNSIFSSFNCEKKTCSAGYEFPVTELTFSVDSIESSFTRANINSTTCYSCGFDLSTCPIADSLCPEVSDDRLVSDFRISCKEEMYPFYLPGSLLLFFAMTVGTPYLFYKIITICKRYIEEIPIKGDLRDKWPIIVYFSRNSCRSLYSDFSYDWRYYKLTILLQKLVIVAIFIFGISQPFLVTASLALSHAIFACLSIYSRPYKQPVENALAVLCLLVNSTNAICALLVAIGVDLGNKMLLALGVLNVVMPVLFILGAMVSTYYHDLRVAKEAEEALKVSFNKVEYLEFTFTV